MNLTIFVNSTDSKYHSAGRDNILFFCLPVVFIYKESPIHSSGRLP